MAPLLFWIILNPEWFTDNGMHITWNYYAAALLFVLASVTDFFDGFIARQLDQMTLVGKIIDPLADKMLVIAAFFFSLVHVYEDNVENPKGYVVLNLTRCI